MILSTLVDMYDNSIISYDISTKTNFEQTKKMLNRAFRKYKNLDGLIFQYHNKKGLSPLEYRQQYFSFSY